jgi:hypothetical protein
LEPAESQKFANAATLDTAVRPPLQSTTIRCFHSLATAERVQWVSRDENWPRCVQPLIVRSALWTTAFALETTAPAHRTCAVHMHGPSLPRRSLRMFAAPSVDFEYKGAPVDHYKTNCLLTKPARRSFYQQDRLPIPTACCSCTSSRRLWPLSLLPHHIIPLLRSQSARPAPARTSIARADAPAVKV